MSRVWILGLLLSSMPLRADVGVRVLLGLMDREGKKWDGSASIDRGKIAKIDPWRFGKDDEIATDGSWKISTAPVLSFLSLIARQTPPVGPNGVILWLSGEDETSEISVKTARGSFSFRLADLPYGKFRYALEGNVAADRIPPSWRLTDSPDEQDYPAAAVAPNGDIWVAYVEFRHHPEHDKLRAPYKDPPKDLSALSAPAEGDQILVKRFAANRWEEPIAITPKGGDLYRPAITVDGSGRPWVFWSENRKNNFDLWARAIEGGKPGKLAQISDAPGSDVFPAAATDSSGRVWVAWQGWRQGKGVIFAATQERHKFLGSRGSIEFDGQRVEPGHRHGYLGTSDSRMGFLPQWQLRHLRAHCYSAGPMGRRNTGSRDPAVRSLPFHRL